MQSISASDASILNYLVYATAEEFEKLMESLTFPARDIATALKNERFSTGFRVSTEAADAAKALLECWK